MVTPVSGGYVLDGCTALSQAIQEDALRLHLACSWPDLEAILYTPHQDERILRARIRGASVPAVLEALNKVYKQNRQRILGGRCVSETVGNTHFWQAQTPAGVVLQKKAVGFTLGLYSWVRGERYDPPRLEAFFHCYQNVFMLREPTADTSAREVLQLLFTLDPGEVLEVLKKPVSRGRWD